jgi:hypothetical protein
MTASRWTGRCPIQLLKRERTTWGTKELEGTMIRGMITLLATSIVLLLVLAAFPPPVSAQQGEISVADVQCLFWKDTIIATDHIRFVLKFTNNTGQRVDVCNGFTVYSYDGAQFDSLTIDTLGYWGTGKSQFASYFDLAFALLNDPSHLQSGPDSVGLVAAGWPTHAGMQLPPGYSDTAVAITAWTGGSVWTNMNKHICIDTATYPIGRTWEWVDASQNIYYPHFVRPAYTKPDPFNPASTTASCYVIYALPCDPVHKQKPNEPLSPLDAACACTSCCKGTTGDVNSDMAVNLADLSALVAYLMGTPYQFPCAQEANINKIGTTDLADLSMLVSYLTGLTPALPYCF